MWEQDKKGVLNHTESTKVYSCSLQLRRYFGCSLLHLPASLLQHSAFLWSKLCLLNKETTWLPVQLFDAPVINSMESLHFTYGTYT